MKGSEESKAEEFRSLVHSTLRKIVADGIPKDFIEGIETFATNGNVSTRAGSAVHLYRCNKDMTDRFFFNADGDLLIVPQTGKPWKVRWEFPFPNLNNRQTMNFPRFHGNAIQSSP